MSDRGVSVCMQCGLIDYRWNGTSRAYENCACDVALHKLTRMTTILNTCLVIQHHGDEREARGRADVVAYLESVADNFDYGDEQRVLRRMAKRIKQGAHVGAGQSGEGGV